MMTKKLILAICVIFILIFAIYQGFFKKEKPTFTLAEVSRGNICQEVSETGQVKKGEEINLSFKAAGQIEKIYAKVGDGVKSGEKLVKLDIASLFIQLQEAEAALDLAQAKLDKLLAGSTPEEIKIAETGVANAQTSLATAQENLDQAFEDALNILDSAYLEGEKSLNLVDTIFRTYFIPGDQPWVVMKDNKDKIKSVLKKIKPYLDTAKTDPKDENIDKALVEMQKGLSEIQEALTSAREMTEDPNYRSIVTSTDKTSLDTQRTYINTALTDITDSQQTISSMELSKETAEGQLQAAKDELALVTSQPQQEDIDLYEAQVKQAQTQVQLLENQIEDTILRSPVDGRVTKINKRVGEQVQPMLKDPVISLLPVAPFEVEVDIYEEDIVKIEIGNPVDIILVAFPDQVFKGKLISIDPAEKLIEGVVYYEVTIGFEELPEKVRPGMTADLIIKTAVKENVLIIPREAIQKKDDKTMVQVSRDGVITEQAIEIGLRGSNNMLEVISGLEEGEKIILF